jgi:UDP-glucose 4-epimerase
LAKLPNLPIITLRPTAVYGPRDKDIFIILKQFAKGFEPYIGRVEQRLSFIYVRDLARITVNTLSCDWSNRTYNLSDGNAYHRYALADFTKQLLNKKTFKIHFPLKLIKALTRILEKVYTYSSKTPTLNAEKLNELNAPNWICDISSAIRELDFKAEYNLKQGLAESYAWYKENKWL